MADEVAEETTSSDDKLMRLPAHKDVWSQKQLFERIISRHFQLLGELGGTRWPVWKVQLLEEGEVNESLEQLNSHLVDLGWLAKLEAGDPWLVQIIPSPERQFPASKTTLGFWSVSILTATLAGMFWIDGSRPQDGWFFESLFLDAFIGYTLPVFAIILLASFAQKYHAQKHGLRVGHLTPIPEPSISLFSIGLMSKSMLIWPFGILTIPTLPRMDARPWKDRDVLGWSALIVPSILIVSGMALWILGLLFTPDLVDVTSMQYVAEMPFLVNILSPLIDDGIATKLVWAHPLSKAGAMLSFFGWVSLLPVPTFPGGRLLIARSSMNEARNSTNQLFLFAVILAFAWMFNAFGSFNIWLPVLGVIFPLLLFLGSDRRIPVILNEPKGIEQDSVKKMGMYLFVIFLLGLPSQIPFAMDQDWDEDIEYRYDDFITIFEGNQSWYGSLTIDIVNPSSISHEWELDLARIDGVVSSDWNLTWQCSDDERPSVSKLGCGDIIKPGMKSSVVLNVTWKSDTYTPYLDEVYLITYINGDAHFSAIELTPDLPVYPNGDWYIDYRSDELKRCIQVFTNLDGYYNVSFPNSANDFDFQTRMYWVEGNPGLTAEISHTVTDICIKGQDPVVLLRSYVLDAILIDGNLFYPNQPELNLQLISPENGTLIDSTEVRGWGSEISPGNILSVADSSCKLVSKVSTPTKPGDSSQWIWNTNYRNTALIPAIQDNDSILVVLEEGDDITICSEQMHPNPSLKISVESGPELILERNGNFHRLWTSIWASSVNGQLSSSNLSEFVFHNPTNDTIGVNIVQTTSGNESTDWIIDNSTNLLLPGENKFKFTPPNSIVSTLWVDFEDGEVYIYLGSYS